jgi:histidinol-phosphatase (PHP family)
VFDYHVHTEFSYDCNLPLTESCPAAIAAGVTEIAFTDHVEHEPGDDGFGYYRAEAYFQAIDEARARWGDRLTILRGAEVDFNERTADDVRRFMERYGDEYDVVIGSVHYGDDRQIIFPDYFAERTLDEVFAPYFERIRLAVESGLFDTIGHLDLPKRYAPQSHRNYDPLRYRALLEPVFEAMIARGVAFEINTSGLRQTPKTSMPGPAIVRWYADAGGRLITTGTDSHAAKTIGAGLETTLAMLPLCGIDAVASFRRRRPTLVPIADLVSASASAR